MNELLFLALGAAQRAGQAIIDIYTSPETDWQVEHKADDSPLTLADRRAHAIIADALGSTGIPLLSEEGIHAPWKERQTWKRLWVVDPLDGTKEFIRRNGQFTVNIALVEDGMPRLGVVHVPSTGCTYYGTAGGGAWRRKPGQRDEALPADRGDRPFTVVASASHMSPETAAYIETLRDEHPGLALATAGSSLKLCRVAEGSADVYPRFAPTMEWDIAAGHAVALAAGRTVTDAHTGQPLHYNKEDLHNPWFIVK